MGTITLAQAWPYITGVLSFFIGIIAIIFWKYIDWNAAEHKEIRVREDKEHNEIYDRLRLAESALKVLEAKCDINHD